MPLFVIQGSLGSTPLHPKECFLIMAPNPPHIPHCQASPGHFPLLHLLLLFWKTILTEMCSGLLKVESILIFFSEFRENANFFLVGGGGGGE